MQTIGQGVIDILVCLFRFQVGLLSWALVEALNELFYLLALPLAALALIFPSLSIEVPEFDPVWLGWINWFLPLGPVVTLYSYAITFFGLWRVLRWVSNRAKTPVQPKLPGF